MTARASLIGWQSIFATVRDATRQSSSAQLGPMLRTTIARSCLKSPNWRQPSAELGSSLSSLHSRGLPAVRRSAKYGAILSWTGFGKPCQTETCPLPFRLFLAFAPLSKAFRSPLHCPLFCRAMSPIW